MKQTTKHWLDAAEDDLIAAKNLLALERLTNLVAFHCQQCIEKCFKSIREEKGDPSVKSHDLVRLGKKSGINLSESEAMLLSIINETYIDSRYPGELGLLPDGKPRPDEARAFVDLAETIMKRIKNSLKHP